MRRLLSWPFTPLLLGLYPVLHLYSINAGHVASSDLLEPLALSLGIAVGLAIVAMVLTRSVMRGAVASSSFLFISFFLTSFVDALFPHVLDSVFNQGVNGLIIGATLLGAWLTDRAVRRASSPSRVLVIANIGALLLVGFPLLVLVRHRADKLHRQAPLRVSSASLSNAAHLPDVYYIILDGYARADVLAADLGYDNSRFIDFLRQKGFYVADKSRSNYAYTYLSLASSLNMGYLSDINMAADQQVECLHRIQDNLVSRLFKLKGYRILHFASGWSVTDYNLQADVIYTSHDMNEFRRILIRNSVLRVVLRREWRRAIRNRIFYTFSELAKIPSMPAPTFTFVHIICPHPPYVFDRQGRTPPPQTFPSRPPGSHDWYPKNQYTDQVDYLNHLVEKALDSLLIDKKNPPIIIVQGDHGAACDGTSAHPTALMVRERMSILNAYYVPAGLQAKLYPTITPVNTFRLIGNYLLNGRFPLLADRSYYSGPMDASPYSFVDVRTLPGDEQD